MVDIDFVRLGESMDFILPLDLIGTPQRLALAEYYVMQDNAY